MHFEIHATSDITMMHTLKDIILQRLDHGIFEGYRRIDLDNLSHQLLQVGTLKIATGPRNVKGA